MLESPEQQPHVLADPAEDGVEAVAVPVVVEAAAEPAVFLHVADAGAIANRIHAEGDLAAHAMAKLW